MPEFQPWPKIARLNRDIIVTEKIDGTNACVVVDPDGTVSAQSRTRAITPADDNYGFARWVAEHADELADGFARWIVRRLDPATTCPRCAGGGSHWPRRRDGEFDRRYRWPAGPCPRCSGTGGQGCEPCSR